MRKYIVNVTFDRENTQWVATIDFPQYELTGLPIQNIRYNTPRLYFELLDDEGLIEFDGEIRGGRIVGGATMNGLTYPYVLSKKQ